MPAKRSSAKRLRTTRAGLREPFASKRFGGITIYAQSDSELQEGFEELVKSIAAASSNNLLMTKNHILAVCREDLKIELPDRLASAAFGRLLALGRISVLPCLTINNRVFRLYFSKQWFPTVIEVLSRTRILLLERGALTPAEVISHNAFTAEINDFVATQILWHFAYKGSAMWAGDNTFVSAHEVIANAIRRTHR